MATAKEAQAVKSLNLNPGGRNRRFVYKSVAERIAEIDIDVFRSLDPVKENPVSGSFILDCLLEWRELNTAEDFISFYKEAMPLVQTYPLVLLHKEFLMSELLSRLQMKARLSLEPILRLIAELSRDLQDDFFIFLPELVKSLVALLKSGADKEPDIIEQIFTSWSYIMMYLRNRSLHVIHVLKVTLKLRYYPKDYIEELMAKSMSFLLRNTSTSQFQKGIRKVVCEVARKPIHVRKFGASVLLYHVLRGTSSHLHSRAKQWFLFFIKDSTFGYADKFTQGSYVVVELVIDALQRIMESNPEGLKLLQDCLYMEISDCATRRNFQHLTRLLSVLISTVTSEKGRKFCDHKQLLEHISFLHKKFFTPTGDGKADDLSIEIAEKILQLILCTLDEINSCCDLLSITSTDMQLAPTFLLEDSRFRSSLVTFLKESVLKDPHVLSAFRNSFFSAIRHLMDMSPVEATDLVRAFIERLQAKAESSDILKGISEEVVSRIYQYFQKEIDDFTELMKGMNSGDASHAQLDEPKVALMWGIVCCYPYVAHRGDASRLWDLVDAVDQCLIVESGGIAGLSKVIFESLIGTALRSYYKLTTSNINELEHTSRLLSLAKRYQLSSQIVSVVADYLDSRRATSASSSSRIKHLELEAVKAMDAVKIFEKNLCNADKGMRISTLRLLSYYEPLTCKSFPSEHTVTQYAEPGDSSDVQANNNYCNVIELLLSIEETTISITTSKKLTLAVSKLQTGISTGGLPEPYISISLHGIIGLFYNYFADLSNPAVECLSILLNKYSGLVWDRFVDIFEQCLQNVLSDHGEDCGTNDKILSYSNDLLANFHLTFQTSCCSRPHTPILVCLLQVLQRVPRISEARSRQIVPLFLRFMGYRDAHPFSVHSFDPHTSKVKGYKGILLEWLSLLRTMRNARSVYHSQFLKDVLTVRLLDENDSDIQIKVLDCLLNWKDEFLAPYGEHLKTLISSKTFREELTTWSLSKESNSIEEGHRKDLVPFIIRLLMPKVRNLKTLASRKHASLSNRKAILGFVAQLDFDELPLFFVMLIKPLLVMEHDTDPTCERFWCSVGYTIQDFQSVDSLKLFTKENIMALPWKKRYAFLHVIEDILGIFNQFQIKPYLDLLSGCVVRILWSCAATLTNGDHHVAPNLPTCDKDADATMQSSLAVKQFKDLRSLCLRIISVILNKYEDHAFDSRFWDMFFFSVKPLIDGFKQEGSSSEKPSSLFSCFLAMSRSRNLVSLLYGKKNLVRDIFSILSVPKASEAVQKGVLNFTENLLNLDMELGDTDNDSRKVLLPSLKALLDSLCLLFHSDHDRKRKLVKHPGETTIRVLKLLSKYMENPAEANKFLEILLLLLQSGVKRTDVCLEILLVLEEVVSMLEVTCTAKILSVLSRLLVHAELDMRLSICKLVTSLAEKDSSLLSTAVLLRDLNATSAMEMDELDYETITMAYRRISIEYFYSVREDHTLLVLSHLIHDMSSNELTLSQSAYESLLCFVEFSAKIIQREEVTMEFSEDCWTRAGIQRIVNKFFLRHMGEAMNKGKDVQKLWVDLLNEMASKLSELPSLKALKALSSQDVEVDFFNNLLHIQKHRRARALLRFTKVARELKLPEVILKRVFMPLFFNMLFDLKDGGEEHLRSACLDALASVSSQMQWKSYYAFLMKCFRDMVKRPEKQRIFLRLICSILDQFHFFEASFAEDVLSPAHSAVDVGTVGRVPSVASEKWANGATISEIQSCLNKCVLQKLQKLRVSESEKVNVHISLAALKVLKLLPADVMDSHLLNVTQHITRLLKHRLESVRDEARAALAACLKEIGFAYLKIIVSNLKAILKQGFERHVLGYSLYYIMFKGLSHPLSGKLDYCVDDLLSVVEEDILGVVSEQKDEEKFASKMKETRKRMSFDTLKLIAQGVTFNTAHAKKLLSPVLTHLQKHLTPKVKASLGNMLSHIAAGIELNPTVDQNDLFIFIYGLVEDGISAESHANASSSAVKVDQTRPDERDTIVVKSRNSHLITEFALGLFHNRLKNTKFDKTENQLLSMLDPFVELFTACLNSRFEEISSAALKCIGHLIKLPLPSLETQADKMKVTLMDIAKSSLNANSPIMQSCFKLLTELLQINKVTLSQEELLVLIKFPLFTDLESNPSFIALSLFKAIIRRRLVDPEGLVYKIVTGIANLMVNSQEEPMRKRCSQILLQFLLNYQLSQKRMQQHFEHLITNLSYEHATGREAVLEMLRVIIEKFPKSFIDKHSDILFIRLAYCMANDLDNQVRKLIGTVIQLLISHISSDRLDSILNICLTWYLGEEQHLWSTAAQILGLFVEALKKGLQKYIGGGSGERREERSVFLMMKRIMKSALSSMMDSEVEFSNEGTVYLWKETYYSLVLFQKILVQFPNLFFQKDVEDIWEAVSEFLIHPHMWIRSISNRLVSLYFQQTLVQGKQVGACYLTRTSRLLKVAVLQCFQLKARVPDDGASESIKSNLAFAICGIYELMGQPECRDMRTFWSSLDGNDQACFVGACQLLNASIARDIAASIASTSGSENEGETSYELQRRLVSSLIETMGKISIQMEDAQTRIVLGSFHLIASKVGQDGCQKFAIQLFMPLYRLCEGFTGRVVSDDVKQQAQEVRESIQETLGTQNFIQAYNQIRNKLKLRRDKRKREEKVMAVVDPVRNAKRKIKLAQKNKVYKKRKITGMKMGRWL